MRKSWFWLLRHTLNRLTLALARSGHGPFSLVRHVGRKSGRTYETPLILAEAPEGFVAELTYGENVDWYRNVVAANGCVVVHRGREHRIDAVEPLPTERGLAAYALPFRVALRALDRREFRLLRVDLPGSPGRILGA